VAVVNREALEDYGRLHHGPCGPDTDCSQEVDGKWWPACPVACLDDPHLAEAVQVWNAKQSGLSIGAWELAAWVQDGLVALENAMGERREKEAKNRA
jgi:hypothetical protein